MYNFLPKPKLISGHSATELTSDIFVTTIRLTVSLHLSLLPQFDLQYHYISLCYHNSTCSITTSIFVTTIRLAVSLHLSLLPQFDLQYHHIYLCYHNSACSITTSVFPIFIICLKSYTWSILWALTQSLQINLLKPSGFFTFHQV